MAQGTTGRFAGDVPDDHIEATNFDSRDGASWRTLNGKLDQHGLSLQARLRKALVPAIERG